LDIQDLGSIGELVGGIAVVASVIYLAIQIRHGISGYQSNAVLQATHHFSILQLEVAKSDSLLSAWIKAEQQQPLDDLEQRRVINVVSSYFIAFENLFTQVQTKVMPPIAYDARRPIIASFLSFTGVYTWWTTLGKHQFPPEFVADVDQCIEDFNISPSEDT
jgi:hypothetical protein